MPDLAGRSPALAEYLQRRPVIRCCTHADAKIAATVLVHEASELLAVADGLRAR